MGDFKIVPAEGLGPTTTSPPKLQATQLLTISAHDKRSECTAVLVLLLVTCLHVRVYFESISSLFESIRRLGATRLCEDRGHLHSHGAQVLPRGSKCVRDLVCRQRVSAQAPCVKTGSAGEHKIGIHVDGLPDESRSGGKHLADVHLTGNLGCVLLGRQEVGTMPLLARMHATQTWGTSCHTLHRGPGERAVWQSVWLWPEDGDKGFREYILTAQSCTPGDLVKFRFCLSRIPGERH